MATSLVGALGAKWPDSVVLFDDNFEDGAGFHGWQILLTDPAGSLAVATSGPLSLSHPSVPGYALVGTSRSIADPAPLSQAVAMKRLSHYSDRASSTKFIVDFEAWVAVGGESTVGASPRYFQLMVDEMYGGTRHFWKARHRYWDESGGVAAKNWYLSSQGQDIYVDTTLNSEPLWNGNKGNVQYYKLSIDLKNLKYLSLQHNKDVFDLTTVAGVTPPGANGDGTFDDPNFNNGLNFMFAAINRGNQAYHSWFAVKRARGSLRVV